MSPVLLFVDYFLWHYTRAFRDLLSIWTNFFWFVIHFFSIPLLLRTLLSPWKRVKEDLHQGSVEDFFAAIVVNIVTRIIGALVRLTIIVLGLISLVLLLVGLFLFLVFWILFPIVIAYLFLLGVALILV